MQKPSKPKQKMIIKNYSKLANKSKSRSDALKIINEGLKSISPSSVFQTKIALKKTVITINNHEYSLDQFNNIYVIGFGKASGVMAQELEKIMGKYIKKGIVVDTQKRKLKQIKVRVGTHPYLSKKNIRAAEDIINLAKQTLKNDLLICLISGGGSALFEKPYNSFIKTLKINQRLLQSGATIHEVNTVRKHISKVKGGNLAKITRSKIISLIFSDVIGDRLENIASGPTIFDPSTILDAQKIIKKYKLPKIRLFETPKNKEIFKKVDNFIILNNRIPLNTMEKEAEKYNYKVRIISNILSGEASKVGSNLSKLAKKMNKKEIYLWAGETTVTIKGHGKGGRNTELALSSFKNLPKDALLISINSDGIDNTDAAGAIIDKETLKKAKSLNLETQSYLNDNDSYNFFKKTGDLIFTGPTGSNVSDLILMLRK